MDLGIAHLPLYTGLTAAALIVLQLVLMYRVASFRGTSSVLIGSGGSDVMEQRIRVHGNLVENAPIFLIALALAEVIAGSSWWILGLALLFGVGRLSHAIGFSMSTGVTKGRLIGTLMTMLAMLVTAGYLTFVIVENL